MGVADGGVGIGLKRCAQEVVLITRTLRPLFAELRGKEKLRSGSVRKGEIRDIRHGLTSGMHPSGH